MPRPTHWFCWNRHKRRDFTRILLEHLSEKINAYFEHPDPTLAEELAVDGVKTPMFYILNLADGIEVMIKDMLAEDGESVELAEIIEGYNAQRDRLHWPLVTVDMLKKP